MIYLRRVMGQSMLPTLIPGQICVFVRARKYEHGDIVLANAGGRPVVKRLHQQQNEVHLKGDNHLATTNYTVGTNPSHAKIVARLLWPRRTALEVH